MRGETVRARGLRDRAELYSAHRHPGPFFRDFGRNAPIPEAEACRMLADGEVSTLICGPERDRTARAALAKARR
ncbi:MAG: hypothetical protein AAB368_11225 [bacterium]